MKYGKGIRFAGVATAAALTLVGAGGVAAAATMHHARQQHGVQVKKPSAYVIGGSLILSTDAATVGQQFEYGIKTELALINKAGGIDGVPVKAAYQDMHLTAAGGVAAFNELTSVDHVQALIQSTSAGTKASAPLATKDHVVMFNPGGVSPNLGGLSPYLFDTIPNLTNEIKAIVPYLRAKGYSRIVLYGQDDDLGTGAAAYLSKLWRESGGHYLGTYLESATTVDHSAVINEIRSKNPQVIFVVANAGQGGTFVSQARQLGLNQPLVGTDDSFGDVTMYAMAGTAANGMIDTAPDLTLSQTNPLAVAYQKEYEKLFPRNLYAPSNEYSVTNADAVTVWADGIRYLVAHHEAYTGKNLRAAIVKIASFNTPSGLVKFLGNGEEQSAINLWKYVGPPSKTKGDHPVLIKTFSLKSILSSKL
jgi:branched-chain amino acid transport system substrate-binding protein